MKIVYGLLALLTAASLTAFESASAAAPGSGRILFLRAGPGAPAPYFVNADGSGLRLAATAPPGAGEFREGRWSPNHKLLALTYRAGLYLAAVDGSSPRRIATGSIEDFSWSPDSTRIVFTRTILQQGLRQLYLVTVHAQPRLFVKAPTDAMAWRATWSPDGTLIAFVVVPPVSRIDQLWVVRPDGSGRRRIAARKDIDSRPQWSADSRWVAYAAHTSRADDVYLVRRDGRAARALTRTSDVRSGPWWAPVGTAIAYDIENHQVSENRVVVFHRTISARRETINDPDHPWHFGPLVWSPDGTQLATNCYGSDNTLCVAKLGRAGFAAIASGASDYTALDWIGR